MATGEITHIEFPADDVERAKRFYGAIAGWEFSEFSPRYWVFRTGATTGGGIGVRGESVGTTVRNYIEVPDLEAAVAAAEANGGTVTTPPSEVPGQGRFAAVLDPEGTEIGLWQNKAS
jgi:uncharacterized protein